MTVGSRLAGHGRWMSCLSLLALVFSIGGCGGGGANERKLAPDQAQITGSLTVKGKNAPTDTYITFESAEKSARATGSVDSLGKFSLSAGDPAVGIPAGPYTVTIRPPSKPVEAMGSKGYEEMMKKGGQSTMAARPPSDIPDKFQSAATSTLKLTVKPGPNDFPIDLDKIQ